jgi:hypothetical protein
MWEFITLAALIGSGIAWNAWNRRLKRHHLKTWKAIVAAHGLKAEKDSVWEDQLREDPLKLKAHSEQFKAWIEELPRGRMYPFQIVVAARQWPPGFADIRLRARRNKPAGPSQVETGDEAFDSTFAAEGPIVLLSVLLDAETRRLLITLSAESWFEIADGELRAEAWHIPDILGFLLDLGRRCARPLHIARRLAQNASQDSNAGVRLKNLLLLAREFPERPETTAALRTACADPSPQIRLRAAKELGAEGHGLLVAFAESVEDDASSAQAIAILGRELPLERTRAILVQALRRRGLQTARACLEALGDGGAPEDIDTLAEVMASEKNELAVAAAKALGRVGTAAAVLPLKEAAEHTGDHDLRRAAHQSIAEIQSRLQGASPGQLSLAGDGAGQLSLATAEAGDLSLADEQGGQLSISAEERE